MRDRCSMEVLAAEMAVDAPQPPMPAPVTTTDSGAVSLLTAPPPLPPLTRENDATRHLAEWLRHAGVPKFWAPHSIWDSLRSAIVRRSWSDLRVHDLGWGLVGSTAPTYVSQVKLARRDGQPDLQVQLFLADVLWLALQQRRSAEKGRTIDVYAFAYVPASMLEPASSSSYWSRVATPRSGRMRMVLEPEGVPNTRSKQATWIDPESGTICPVNQSQYNKIFTGSSSTCLIGLFLRRGRLEIECDVALRHLTTTSGEPYVVVVYRVRSFEAKVEGDFWTWFP